MRRLPEVSQVHDVKGEEDHDNREGQLQRIGPSIFRFATASRDRQHRAVSTTENDMGNTNGASPPRQSRAMSAHLRRMQSSSLVRHEASSAGASHIITTTEESTMAQQHHEKKEEGPAALLIMNWQRKAERMERQLRAVETNYSALELDHAKMKTELQSARELQSSLESELAVQKNLAADRLAHLQAREGSIHVLHGELDALKALRSEDANQLFECRKELSELEMTLWRFQNRSTVSVSTQTADVQLSDAKHSLDIEARTEVDNASGTYYRPSADDVVYAVRSLPRGTSPVHQRQSNSVNSFPSQGERFLQGLARGVEADPELSSAFGSLFANGKRSNRNITSDNEDRYDKTASTNIFDRQSNFEETDSIKSNKRIPLLLTPPKLRTVSNPPGPISTITSPPPREPLTCLPPSEEEIERHSPLHLKPLFPEGLSIQFPHVGVTSSSFRSREERNSFSVRDRLSFATRDGGASRGALQEPLSPQLISTVVSPVSSTGGGDDDFYDIAPTSNVANDLFAPVPIPAEKALPVVEASKQQSDEVRFVKVNVPAAAPSPPSTSVLSLSPKIPVGDRYDELSSPVPTRSISATPLPRMLTSASPYRNKASVERIERLRTELQSLIDMRLRLQSPI